MGLFDFVVDIVKAPITIVADTVTLGGTLNDRDKTYTGSLLDKLAEDIDDMLE